MDKRREALQEWVARSAAGRVQSMTALAGDASFRRYFRVNLVDGGSLVAMDAPPGKENTSAFLRVQQMLQRMGVLVPFVVAEDASQGFLLMADLGDRTWLEVLSPDNVDGYYARAIDTLIRIQVNGRAEVSQLPEYDRDLLLQEMHLFRDWYLRKRVGMQLGKQDIEGLDTAFDYLADAALAQPRVFVHRDFHSRNLIVTPGGRPGVVDFQDAVQGPLTYDLVSLLRDCYIAWPRQRVEGWALDYLGKARKAGLTGMSDDEFLRAFYTMGVQRHLKAVGIFARLRYRDGKPGYLADIPRTLAYIRQYTAESEALAGLARVIDRSMGKAAA